VTGNDGDDVLPVTYIFPDDPMATALIVAGSDIESNTP
jgi:hypothetical protein